MAAAISNGVAISKLGTKVKDAVRLASLAPTVGSRGSIEGRVIHIDHFGNCITNFTREQIKLSQEVHARIRINGKKIKSFRQFYGEEPSCEKLFAIWGSAGFLEVAVRNGSAAEVLKIERGERVSLLIDS